MIMSNRIVRMLAHDFEVAVNGLRVVFDAQGIVCVNIAYVRSVSTRDGTRS